MEKFPILKTMEVGIKNFSTTSRSEHLKSLAKNGQKPEAIVVTCSDSRVAPESLFGVEVGQLFVIRVAGNVVGVNELASIEFAALALNVPLCVVIGHTGCGAVSASVDWHMDQKTPPTAALESLVKEIEPAVEKVKASCGKNILQSATEENVRRVIESIAQKSPSLNSRINQGEFSMKGAVLDIHNVCLNWLS